jgi:hypothetical protein
VNTIGEAATPPSTAYTQAPASGQAILARTRGDAGALLGAMQEELRALEPNVVLLNNQKMETQVGTTLLPARLGAIGVSVVGMLAMLLAAVGLYGAVAYSVGRRTREIGIRMALGASRGAVLRLVMRQGLRVAAAGHVQGAVRARGCARGVSGAVWRQWSIRSRGEWRWGHAGGLGRREPCASGAPRRWRRPSLCDRVIQASPLTHLMRSVGIRSARLGVLRPHVGAKAGVGWAVYRRRDRRGREEGRYCCGAAAMVRLWRRTIWRISWPRLRGYVRNASSDPIGWRLKLIAGIETVLGRNAACRRDRFSRRRAELLGSSRHGMSSSAAAAESQASTLGAGTGAC